MSIADKLTIIAENMHKVWETGRIGGYNNGYDVGYEEGKNAYSLPTVTLEGCEQNIKGLTAYLEENITPTVTGTTWFIRADGDTSLYYCQGFLYVSGVLIALFRATDTGGLYVAEPSETNGGAMWQSNTTFYRIDII